MAPGTTLHVEAAKAIETGYIKTPSIVLSHAAEGIGGHNLYGRTTRVESASLVPPGKVQFVERGGETVIEINPQDASHSSDLARAYERNATRDRADVERVLERELAVSRPVRAPANALALRNVPASDGRGLRIADEGNPAIGEIGAHPDFQAAEVIARYERIGAERKLDTLVLRDSSGYHVFRFQPSPAMSVSARNESSMLEVVGRNSDDAVRARGAVGEPPVRVGFDGNFSEREVDAIRRSQEMRTAGGGNGGWEPPSPPRTALGGMPSPEKPNGYFFVDDRPGQPEMAGYESRTSTGDPVSLRAAGDAKVFREVMGKQVDWAKAKVRPIDNLHVEGELASMNQVAFEIEVPLTDPPFLEAWHLRSPRPLLVRVFSFFKRSLTPADRDSVAKSISKAIEANAKATGLTADGTIALKLELLRELKVDELRFQFTYGDSDIRVVQQRQGLADDGRG